MLKPQEYVNEHLNRLNDYIDSVTGGTITVGKYERLAVERYLKHKSEFIYKEAELIRILRFFSLLNIPINNETRQFEVMPFQMLWLASIFALYRTEDKKLYNQTYILCSKKNNKTTICAAIAIYVTICYNVLNAHSLLVASSREQARTLINAVEFIVKNSPALTDIFQVNKNIIYNRNDKTINKIEIRSSDAGKINGLGAGMFLSVVDEYSYHPDGLLQQNIKSAQAFIPNHHQIIIGTASNDLENPSFTYYEAAKNVLDGIADNDEVFIMLYELDDKNEYQDEKNWRKPNPALGYTISVDTLRSELKSTIAFPQNKETVLTHHFNIWTNHETESFIDDDIIKAIMRENRSIPTGSTVYLGSDLSSLNDLSAIAALWYNQPEDTFTAKIYHVFPNNEKRRIKGGSIDLAKWFVTADNPDGHITRCESKSLDESVIINLVKEINTNNNVQGFYFDPFNARIIATRLESELGIVCSEVRQNYTMSYPLKFIEKYLNEGKLYLDQNPCTRWQFRNLRVKTDRNNNYLIAKKGGESVDGIVALTCAMAGFLNDNYSTFGNKLDAFNW